MMISVWWRYVIILIQKQLSSKIELAKPVDFDETVSPICLPNKAQVIPDDGIAVATGFGLSNSE